MHLGIHVVTYDDSGGAEVIAPTLTRTAQAAEAIGARSLSVMDHYFQMEAAYPAELPMLEGYTTLGFLAAHTSRLELHLLVTGVTYRHPGLLAKIVASLDVLSGGRAGLGIGAAWYEREHLGLGVPFPPLSERFERLEEALRICLQMWDPKDTGPFEGRHYQLAETLCSPAPIQSPRPPILIGGTGERKTLRLVAQYADACNFFGAPVDEIKHKLDVLRRHCDDVGRDEATIHKTILYRSPALEGGDVDTVVSDLASYAALGVDEAIFVPETAPSDEWIERVLAPLAPRLAELRP